MRSVGREAGEGHIIEGFEFRARILGFISLWTMGTAESFFCLDMAYRKQYIFLHGQGT